MRCNLRFAACLALSLAATAALAQSSTFEAASKASLTNVMLAESYLQAGDLNSAFEKANRAVEKDAKSAEAHAVLGMVYDRMNKQDRAQASFDRAVKLAPESGVVLNVYAAWHCQHGRYAEADAQFIKALADPLYKLRYQSMYNAAQCAMLGRNLTAADGYYRMILDERSEDPAALESLALIHMDKGDAFRARAFIQRREAAAPVTADVLDLAARIEEAAGDRATAAKLRQRRQEEFPEAAATDAAGSSQP